MVQLPLSNPELPDSDVVADEDELVFRGGAQQRFRCTRPLVEGLLDGYDAEFLGMLESPMDGIGVWTTSADMTVLANVNSATFAPFARVCGGAIGNKLLRPGHTILLVNSDLGESGDVGNLWERDLKSRAREIIDEWPWQSLYCMQPVRTRRGNRGWICQTWPYDWAVLADDDDNDCVLTSATRPGFLQAARALDAAAAAE